MLLKSGANDGIDDRGAPPSVTDLGGTNGRGRVSGVAEEARLAIKSNSSSCRDWLVVLSFLGSSKDNSDIPKESPLGSAVVFG